jgi:isopentenyl-diphosphate Delta-isomerase
MGPESDSGLISRSAPFAPDPEAPITSGMNSELWGSRADERLVLVDGNDAPVGTDTRARCHAPEGLRHRAFSVYLFDREGRLLIHQRHDTKPLWPGFWSNSCCSHPVGDEDVADAARRRVREELGATVEIAPIHRYEYRATYGDVGTEHEVVTVFIGKVEPHDLQPDPIEVADFRFIEPGVLDAEIGDGERYTPWFQLAWPVVRDATSRLT